MTLKAAPGPTVAGIFVRSHTKRCHTSDRAALSLTISVRGKTGDFCRGAGGKLRRMAVFGVPLRLRHGSFQVARRSDGQPRTRHGHLQPRTAMPVGGVFAGPRFRLAACIVGCTNKPLLWRVS